MAADSGGGAGRSPQREAWVMWLKPGNEEIYQRKHDEIWPEMVEQIHAQGTRNFSIYRTASGPTQPSRAASRAP
jgi:hypothetical protein